MTSDSSSLAIRNTLLSSLKLIHLKRKISLKLVRPLAASSGSPRLMKAETLVIGGAYSARKGSLTSPSSYCF